MSLKKSLLAAALVNVANEQNRKAATPASQPTPAPCTRCNGEGSIDTGIDESPTTLCNKCNGTGEPDGYKAMPPKPTLAMIAAGKREYQSAAATIPSIYVAMFNAAPELASNSRAAPAEGDEPFIRRSEFNVMFDKALDTAPSNPPVGAKENE